VIESALGNGKPQTVSWEGVNKTIPTMTLSQIIQTCGGKVDFLKCDCEGGEWQINPGDLAGVRRIEMELHYFRRLKPNPSLLEYIGQHYTFTIEQRPDNPEVQILHATIKEEP
jgi:hypothetical protein